MEMDEEMEYHNWMMEDEEHQNLRPQTSEHKFNGNFEEFDLMNEDSYYSDEDGEDSDDSNELLDYDPYEVKAEKRSRIDDDDNFKENANPFPVENYFEDFLRIRLDSSSPCGFDQDKYIEENALVDISNCHNSLAQSNKFNSKVTDKTNAEQ